MSYTVQFRLDRRHAVRGTPYVRSWGGGPTWMISFELVDTHIVNSKWRFALLISKWTRVQFLAQLDVGTCSNSSALAHIDFCSIVYNCSNVTCIFWTLAPWTLVHLLYDTCNDDATANTMTSTTTTPRPRPLPYATFFSGLFILPPRNWSCS